MSTAPGRLVVPGALLLALAGCTPGSGAGREAREPAAQVSSAPATEPAAPVSPARRARSVLRTERPVAVRLPSGVVVPVRTASTTPAGLLDVPGDVSVAGWWDGGARLGDPFGSTLVAAHVDSRRQGLGPFAELLTLGGGERVRLDSPGLTQEFEVRSLRLVPQGPLTARAGIFAPSGPRRLTMVTCAPPYVRSRGGYQRLAVVTAVPVSPAVRRAGR